MKRLRPLVLVSLLLCLAGCYAASIDTGRPASTKVIEKPWASCWLYGLVPPSTVMTATECPGGVAKVETQLSFLNQVVSILTFGIYTPMQIVVTCAEPSTSSLTGPESDLPLAADASADEIRATFAKAADEAVKSHRAVFVRRDQ